MDFGSTHVYVSQDASQDFDEFEEGKRLFCFIIYHLLEEHYENEVKAQPTYSLADNMKKQRLANDDGETCLVSFLAFSSS